MGLSNPQYPSEALFDTLQDVTNEGILIIGLKGNVLAYNKQFLKIWDIPNSVAKKEDDQFQVNLAVFSSRTSNILSSNAT